MNTYTPWATNVKSLEKSCSIEIFEMLKASGCGDFIPNPLEFRDFVRLVQRLITVSMDHNAWYVRLGGVSTDYTDVIPYKEAKTVSKITETNSIDNNNNNNIGNYENSKYNGIEILDILVIENSTFSMRVFDSDFSRLAESRLQMKKVSCIYFYLFIFFLTIFCIF